MIDLDHLMHIQFVLLHEVSNIYAFCWLLPTGGSELIHVEPPGVSQCHVSVTYSIVTCH